MHADINKISIFTAIFCCLIFNCMKSYYSKHVLLFIHQYLQIICDKTMFIISDDDSDYCDAVETNVDDNVVNVRRKETRVNQGGVKVRGKDLEWFEVAKFKNAEDFSKSEIKKNVLKNFSRRKNRNFEYGVVENFVCKYARKVGYQPCPLKYKVTYFSTSFDVMVESNDCNEVHIHEEDAEAVEHSKQFRWTNKQTDIITTGVLNHAKPNVIKRNLNNANVFPGSKPTKVQLYNKIANLKRIVFPSEKITNSHDLRQRVAANLEVPEDELEGYVIDHEIDDEKEEEDPRFTIIFSTRKNMSKLRSDRVFQLDATYRLNWNGFPVFVGGKC